MCNAQLDRRTHVSAAVGQGGYPKATLENLECSVCLLRGKLASGTLGVRRGNIPCSAAHWGIVWVPSEPHL